MAVASGEARAFSPDVLKHGLNQLLSLERSETVRSLKDNFPCTIDIEILGNWQPWPSNQDSERLLSVWQESAKVMGYAVIEERRGGLSDGNWLWETMPTLDGLGPSGGNAHCSERNDDGSKDQEFVRLSSFVPKATLNALALYNLFSRD
jgi:glutamate carboxypeptidase